MSIIPDPPTNLSDKFDALARHLATQHAETLTAIAALSASMPGTGLATEATSAAILAAIGTLASYPENYTVKELLAMLNASIDVAPGTGSGSSLNPDNYGCVAPDWVAVYRARSMANLGSYDSGDGVMWDVYTPQLEPTTPYTALFNPTVITPDPSFLFDGGSSFSISICCSWNYDGMTDAPACCQVTGNDTTMLLPSGFYPSLNKAFHGQYPFEFTGGSPYPLGTGQLVSYRFAVPAGSPALLPNVFMHVKGNANSGLS